MSTLIAPYTTSMRIGSGFNSYTQTVCLRNAIKDTSTTTNRTPLRIDYSTRFIDDFSDVVKALGISPAAYIKNAAGRDVSGINIEKFEAADFNILIHVKVITSIETLYSDIQLSLLDGPTLSPDTFNSIYGDTFISGFQRGGNFVGLVSLRAFDRSKVSELRTELENALSKTRSTDFKSFAAANIADFAEATVFVSWSGGHGQNPTSSTWDMESVFRAASSFAKSGSDATENVGAILTKWSSISSFLESRTPFKTLNYDVAEGYTFDLLADCVTYSSFLRRVESMRRFEGSAVGAGKSTSAGETKEGGYAPTATGLNAARRDIRKQLLAIAAEVDLIATDPSIALDTTRSVFTDPYDFATRLPPSLASSKHPFSLDIPAPANATVRTHTSLSAGTTEPLPWKWVQVPGCKANSPVLFTHGKGKESSDAMMLKIYEWEVEHPGEYIAGFDIRNGRVYKKIDPYQLAKSSPNQSSPDGLNIRVLLDDRWKFVPQRYIKTENSNARKQEDVGRDIIADLLKFNEDDSVAAFDYNGSWVTSLREDAITAKGSGFTCRGIWIRKGVHEALDFRFDN